ncbi:DUF4350 domain-containing protein [Arenimonas sp.]|uniref:DUF4350 domain-containing protein n=1 Tax=Arenimonas sp. TaxID=1872635 RepID=UPI0039E30F77
MKRGTVAIIAVGIALVVAAGIAGFLHFFKQVEMEVRLPPRGEAAYNPLYALKKTLQARGLEVQTQAWLDLDAMKPAPGDTLVLYTQPESVTQAQADALLAWIEAGGHLVMPSPQTAEAGGPLAEAFALYAIEDEERDCDYVASGMKDRGNLSFCRPRFASDLDEVSYGSGDEDAGYRFARFDWGAGVVSVISDLDFLDNQWLESRPARDMAFSLLAPRLDQGRMLLVYSAESPSLGKLILMYGWMIVLPLMLALFAWLTMRAQRFGPLQPAPEARRRALLEHVRAAGEFAWRRHRSVALHAAVLQLLRKRLALRDPLIAALDGDAQVDALSQRLGIDAGRIRQALRPVGLNRPDAFLQSISTLIDMRNRL